MLSVAIIGAGTIVGCHLKALKDDTESRLCAVADVVREKAEKAAASFGAAVYTDYLEMLDKEKPEAVIINLPHGLHEACVAACAKRGISMLLEKPMSVSGDSCDRMNSVCEENGVLLQVGHIQRYIAENRAARALIESGELGDLVMINDQRTVNYFAPSRPRWFLQKSIAGGGIWINYGAHALDKLCYLTDSTVESIVGQCSYPAEFDVDGSAQALVRTASGVTDAITICGYGVVPIHETMLYLTNGSIRLRTGEALWVCRGDSGVYEPVDVSGYEDAFVAQWRDFTDGIREGRIRQGDGAYAAEIVRKIETLWG